jgi:hypothetical protein
MAAKTCRQVVGLWGPEVRAAQDRVAKIDAAEYPEAYERAAIALLAAVARAAREHEKAVRAY